MRLFFAICLRASTKLTTHLERYAGRFDDAGYRMVPTVNLHMTLSFIGNADAYVASQMLARGAGVAAAPFIMTLGGPLMGLPNRHRPRVLAYGARDTGGLSQLVGQLDDLGRAGAFLPHVTVARAKGVVQRPVMPDLPIVEIPVNSFCLMNSQLGREGAVYSILKEFPLR